MSNRIKKYEKLIIILIGIISLPVIALILKYCFYLGLIVGKYLRFL